MAIGTDMFVVAGLLGQIAADLEVSVGVAGVTITVFAIAYATGAPLLGALLAGRNQRRVLIMSLLIFGCCAATSALAPTLTVLLGARVLAGLAASGYAPAAAAYAVATQPPDRRGRVLGVLQGASSTAMLAGAPLGLLLAAALSWRATFGLVLLTAVVAVLGLLRCDMEGVHQRRLAPRDRFALMASPAVLGTLGATVLLMAGSNSLYSFLGVLLGGVTGADGLWLFVAAFGVGGVLGTWLGGAAADRWGGRWPPLLAGACLLVVFAVLPLAASTAPAALAIAVCWGASGWAFMPGQQHRLAGMCAGPPTFLLALNSSAVQVGFATGALLGGLLVDAAGAGALWILAVGCASLALAVQAAPAIRRQAVRS
jgi:predicted MFS family arabinose efflux permease